MYEDPKKARVGMLMDAPTIEPLGIQGHLEI
jgi:hypothetical protein